MYIGIPNIGNSCYAAAVTQCLRRIFGLNVQLNHGCLSKKQEDPHDFYMNAVDALPDEIKKRIMVTCFKRKDEPYTQSFISLNHNMVNLYNTIVKVNDLLCIHRITPTLFNLKDILIINLLNVNYKAVAAVVASTIQGSHYVAIVEHDNEWVEYNDSNVSKTQIDTLKHLYMIFYEKI